MTREQIEEGRRFWSHYMKNELTVEAMWSWFDLHHDALLAAAERALELEQKLAEVERQRDALARRCN